MPRYLDPEENMYLFGISSFIAEVSNRFLLGGPGGIRAKYGQGLERLNTAKQITQAQRMASVTLASLKKLHGEETDDMFFDGVVHLREGVIYADILYRFIESSGHEPTYDLMKETLSKIIEATRGLRRMLYGRPAGSSIDRSTMVTEEFFPFLIDDIKKKIILREEGDEKRFQDECSRLALF